MLTFLLSYEFALIFFSLPWTGRALARLGSHLPEHPHAHCCGDSVQSALLTVASLWLVSVHLRLPSQPFDSPLQFSFEFSLRMPPLSTTRCLSLSENEACFLVTEF